MVVATWTWWVDLKVVARSRNGSLIVWFDPWVGCVHDGQISSGVGCSWRSDWLRGGSFTGSWTHGGPIYFPVATLRMRDGLVEDEGKGWIGKNEGWVGGVPSPCSAWGIGLLSLGVSPVRMCFRWSVLVCVSRSLSVLSLLALSLSLSLFGCLESENHLKVKEKHKWFFESKGLFYGQSLRFSEKLYFTCAPRHTARCKIFSGNHLHPKQT